MIKDIFSKIKSKESVAKKSKHFTSDSEDLVTTPILQSPNADNEYASQIPMTYFASKSPADLSSTFSGLKAGYITNIGARPQQQDSLLISDLNNEVLCSSNGVLALVADGMGGLANGAKISASIADMMNQLFSDTSTALSPQNRLLFMTYEAANSIRNYLIKEQADMSGSTLAAVIIYQNKLSFLSIGDSRIYLVRNGLYLQLNREHSYSVELDEAAARGEIFYEEAANHPKRNALTSYIGNIPIEHIDRSTRPIKLVKGDSIVIMSDGVYGTLSDETLERIFVKDNPAAAAKAIEKEILAAAYPNQDNFTAVILSL